VADSAFDKLAGAGFPAASWPEAREVLVRSGRSAPAQCLADLLDLASRLPTHEQQCICEELVDLVDSRVNWYRKPITSALKVVDPNRWLGASIDTSLGSTTPDELAFEMVKPKQGSRDAKFRRSAVRVATQGATFIVLSDGTPVWDSPAWTPQQSAVKDWAEPIIAFLSNVTLSLVLFPGNFVQPIPLSREPVRTFVDLISVEPPDSYSQNVPARKAAAVRAGDLEFVVDGKGGVHRLNGIAWRAPGPGIARHIDHFIRSCRYSAIRSGSETRSGSFLGS